MFFFFLPDTVYWTHRWGKPIIFNIPGLVWKLTISRSLTFTFFLSEASNGGGDATTASKGKLLVKNACLVLGVGDARKSLPCACWVKSGHTPGLHMHTRVSAHFLNHNCSYEWYYVFLIVSICISPVEAMFLLFSTWIGW